MKLRERLGSWLRFGFSMNEAIVEGVNTTDSLLHSIKPKKGTPLKISIGIAAAVIEFVTCYNFQGKAIEKNAAGHEEEDEENRYDPVAELSYLKKFAYPASRYGYCVTSLADDCGGVLFLTSASIAYINRFYNPKADSVLVDLTSTQAVLGILYFLKFDLPFILTGEMWETLKEMRERMGISPEKAWDKPFIDKLQKLIKPLAESNFFRKYVRTSGALGDMLEHLIPFILFIEPSWILALLEAGAAGWSVLAGIILTIILIAGTVFAQSYLFEGKFCEANLKAIAGDHSVSEPKIPHNLARLFQILLVAVAGPLHGVDTALSIFLTLKSFKSPMWATAPLTLGSFLIAWLGNHFSEVMESKEELAKMTLPATPRSEVAAKITRFSEIFKFRTRNHDRELEKLPFAHYPRALKHVLPHIETEFEKTSLNV